MRRSGNCEYFAAAMAVMLRSIGVPARVAAGFQQGEWNPYGRYFMVRLSDAHAWVEVYLDGRGWVAFDPSPRAEAMAEEIPGRDVALLSTPPACAGIATWSTGACATRCSSPPPSTARPPTRGWRWRGRATGA